METQEILSSPAKGTIAGDSPAIDKLKNLRLEDFQAPNRVLCYGAGEMGKWIVDSYLRAGVNVVGFIDQNKQGKMPTSKGELTIYTLQGAVSEWGMDIVVVITIAASNIHSAVKQNLLAAGIKDEHIYDHDFINWLTVPSEKCYCKSLSEEARLFTAGLAQCCYWADGRVYIPEFFDMQTPFDQICNRYIDKLQYFYEQSLVGRVPLYCQNCPHLEAHTPSPCRPRIKFVSFGATAHCNLECVYCTAMFATDMAKLPCDAKGYGENFLSLLEILERREMLDAHAEIGFGGGELSVAPTKKELLAFVAHHPNYRYSILSNCVVYNETIAQALSWDNENLLMCDLDAGTAETYTLVKGYNHFARVIQNLKTYSQYGRIVLKYIVMPGFNTDMENYNGTVKLLRELNLQSLTLSQENQYAKDFFSERKTLYETARFKNILIKNDIEAVMDVNSFDARQIGIINRLCRELSKGSGGK